MKLYKIIFKEQLNLKIKFPALTAASQTFYNFANRTGHRCGPQTLIVLEAKNKVCL